MKEQNMLDEDLHRPFTKVKESELYLLKLDLENADTRTYYGSIALYIIGGLTFLTGLIAVLTRPAGIVID